MVNEKDKVITVRFTAVNSGDHKVCYTIDGGTEVCTTITNVQQGVVTEAQFPVKYSDPGLSEANINGYVQPTCGTPGDGLSQGFFTAQIIVDSICSSYTLKCEEASILAVKVTDPGTGYNGWPAPTLIIDDPTGSGAVIEVIMDGNKIDGVEVINQGSGYTDPEVTISSGTGSGAKFEVISTNCSSGDTYTGCHGEEDNYPTVGLGESRTICYNSKGAAPTAPPEYSMTSGTGCWSTTENIKIKNDHVLIDSINGDTKLQIQFVDLSGKIVNRTINESAEKTYQVARGSLAIMNINELADPTKVNISIV